MRWIYLENIEARIAARNMLIAKTNRRSKIFKEALRLGYFLIALKYIIRNTVRRKINNIIARGRKLMLLFSS
jgi:hypothetical protein